VTRHRRIGSGAALLGPGERELAVRGAGPAQPACTSGARTSVPSSRTRCWSSWPARASGPASTQFIAIAMALNLLAGFGAASLGLGAW